MRILVIGAGASGLVTAKVLLERGHDVCIVEAGAALGGTFENKSYQDARMVSSKHLTCFSDYRRTDAEMHMSLVDYVAYLRDYARDFKLEGLLRFNTRVLGVERNDAGVYVLRLQCGVEGEGQETREETWDAVAVCSGLHNTPNVPEFPGQESFGGEILHSAAYKDPAIFRGKRVLIVGTGETSFDLGYAAATQGASSVTMSTRHGFVSVPAVFPFEYPPLDCVIMNWATHAWESKWAQRVGMHWFVTTKFTRIMFFLATGTTYGFNQWVGKRHNMTWDQGRKHIVNKSSKCMPYLSRAAKRNAVWWRRKLYGLLDPEDGTDIDLVEGSITRFEKGAAHYETKSGPVKVEADVVVLATGYRQRFPFLHAESGKDDPLPSQHFIVNPEEPRMAYIGFVRPNVGAIPPMAEMQAMWWCQKLEGALATVDTELDVNCYKLHERKLDYGVDYGYYMFALAREIGSMPSLLHWLFRSPRVAITCAFGQAHVPLFRLQGPFRSAVAEEACKGELFSVILQRPIVMNSVFVLEAIGFGVINGIAILLEEPCRRTVAFVAGTALAAIWSPRFRALGGSLLSGTMLLRAPGVKC